VLVRSKVTPLLPWHGADASLLPLIYTCTQTSIDHPCPFVASTTSSSTTDKSNAKSSMLASCARLLVIAEGDKLRCPLEAQRVPGTGVNTPPQRPVLLSGRRCRVHAQQPECDVCTLRELLTPVAGPHAFAHLDRCHMLAQLFFASGSRLCRLTMLCASADCVGHAATVTP
jgi:hypothetical protein